MKIKADLIIIIILCVALVAALWLAASNQETRRGAYFATATMSLLPDQKIEALAGDDVTTHLYVTAVGSSAAIQNVRSYLCWDSQLTMPASELDSRVVLNTANGFTEKTIQKLETVSGKNCLNLSVASDKMVGLKTNAVEVATIKFKANGAGDGGITIDKDKSMVTGVNLTSDDKVISISEVAGTTYSIGAQTEGVDPVLRFKIAYRGVGTGSSCAVAADWPVQVTVMSRGITQVHTGVILTRSGSDNGTQLFEGKVYLTGFPYLDKIAVFVKGSKHLMNKYGVDNQQDFYNNYDGNLVLTKYSTTTTVYNFAKYPLMPGDVVGGTNDTQDGIVDGRDYSYVKTKEVAIETTNAGGNLKADLDGTCKVNGADMTQLLITLSQRQEQLY